MSFLYNRRQIGGSSQFSQYIFLSIYVMYIDYFYDGLNPQDLWGLTTSYIKTRTPGDPPSELSTLLINAN